MHPFLARFSEPAWSGHLPSWADFITTTSGFRFRYTQVDGRRETRSDQRDEFFSLDCTPCGALAILVSCAKPFSSKSAASARIFTCCPYSASGIVRSSVDMKRSKPSGVMPSSKTPFSFEHSLVFHECFYECSFVRCHTYRNRITRRAVEFVRPGVTVHI